MKFPVLKVNEQPMRALTLEEYADFVGFFMKDADPECTQHQKKHEENITKRFCIINDQDK